MTRKTIKIAQVLIAGIFVAAIAYVVAGIAIDKKTGPLRAQERFDHFMQETSTLAAKYEPNTPEFNGEFTRTIGDITQFSALQLEVNGRTIYTYPPEQTSDSSGLVVTDFSGTTATLLGNTLSVRASLYSLNPEAIYRYAKVAFVLILAGTIAAIVLLIIIQIQFGSKRYAKRRVSVPDEISITDETPPVSTPDDEALSESDSPETESSEMDSLETDIIETESARQASAPDADQFASADEEEALLLAQEDDFDPIGAMEEENREAAEDTDSLADDDDVPQPDGPVRSQLALEPELQTELTDAIAGETDVSVLIVRIPQFREDSPAAAQLNTVLAERIGRQGIIYGYNDGYAIVIRNTTLDSALATGQALYTVIAQSLNANGMSPALAIGISARSERVISAKRLITEAEQAALHTDDENPIIAFRVNPERYREYMQNKH